MTEAAFVLAPLACAAVLILSGVAKYGDPDGTRAAFTAMRVPASLSTPRAVRALPVVEIVLGVLLLVTWAWTLAAVSAVVTALFAVYWVLVFLVLRRGDDVDCGCFGAAGDDKVTPVTLARNSLLIAFGALSTAFGAAGSGVLPTLADLRGDDFAWLLMTAGVIGAAVLVVGHRRDKTRLGPDTELLDYERERIPFAMLKDAEGHTTTLRELAASRPQLLVFLSSSCGACHDVAARLPEWAPRLAPVEIQTVFTDPLAHLPPGVTPPGIKSWFDVERGATDRFADGRPSAVLLGADGSLAGGPVAGKPAVEELVEDIVAELEAASVSADSEG